MKEKIEKNIKVTRIELISVLMFIVSIILTFIGNIIKGFGSYKNIPIGFFISDGVGGILFGCAMVLIFISEMKKNII